VPREQLRVGAQTNAMFQVNRADDIGDEQDGEA
jgi:hypothetical protein